MVIGAVQQQEADTGTDPASELLLLFARLLGPRRNGTPLPTHVKALLDSGFLAPRHLRAFAVITLAGQLTVSELAHQEGLALSTASLLVTQLADAGLVERHEDVADRRRTVVSVAPQHRRDSRAVLESKLAPLRRALDRMGPRQTRALIEGLNILMEEVDRGTVRPVIGETAAGRVARKGIG